MLRGNERWCLFLTQSLKSRYRSVFPGYMLRRGALSSQFCTTAQLIQPSIRSGPVHGSTIMEPQPTSQRGKPPRPWPHSHRRPADSQSGGDRGSPYRGRGGGRGRGNPRRRGRGGGYADRSGPGPAGPGLGSVGPAGPSVDMGPSQFTGMPMSMPIHMPMPMPPGNMPWWGYMNPAGGSAAPAGLPFIPPPHPTGNPNFAMPAMPAMFNPTIPMFSPFNTNPNLDTPRHTPRHRNHDASPRVVEPNAPEATARYLTQASQPPIPTSSTQSQPLLIILDLNGTLIHRRNRKFPPKFTRRSLLDSFLATLLLKHKVMVWSSSQPKTVKAICQQLFSPMQRKALLAEWGRDKLNLTSEQYKNKVQVYKTLDTVWGDQAVQARYPRSASAGANAKTRWDQSNTVLLDDSKLKAVSEPFNIIELPEYEGFETAGQDGDTIFPRVLSRLEMLSRHDDVSKVLHAWSQTNTGTGTKNFLDFELDELDRQNLFNVSGLQPDPTPNPNLEQSRSSKEEAHIQKRLLRKAMKNERKAAKEARDATSVHNNPNSSLYRGTPTTTTTTPDAGSEQSEHDVLSSKARKKQMREEQRKQRRAEKRAEDRRERSPSGSLSSQSESVSSRSDNQLLDRLEESLTV